MTPLQVSSPDGRRWVIETSRSHRSMKETYQTPYFWGHVIATVIMVLFFVLVLKSDWTGILVFLIPLTMALWFFGFVSKTLRATISADTDGPPREHRRWTVTKRFGRDRCVRELAEAIQAGQLSSEPHGTRLDEI